MKRIIRAALTVLIVPSILAGCGKTETVSTDTAVTETIALDETEAEKPMPADDSVSSSQETDTTRSVEPGEN